MAKEAVGKKKLSDMVHLRSTGKTIDDTAFRLGLLPWNVSYLTRMLRVCVSAEELQYLEEQAEHHGFSTVGELIMDVFNTSYEEHYFSKKRKKRVRRAS